MPHAERPQPGPNSDAQCRVGIIFDLDGTLVDTLSDIAASLNVAFADEGLPTQTADHIRKLIGEGLKNLVRRAAEVDDEKIIDRLVKRYRTVYREHMLDDTTLYPGVAEMLDGLRERGAPMSVLSNKPHDFTAPICKALLGRWPFFASLGSVDEPRRKPDPRTALELAEQMQVPPAAMIFVGDSSVDILTARNAGMISVAVTWGYRDRDELTPAAPDFLIDSPGELLKVVNRSRASG